ncbi:hypothetical protein J3459_014061 [Metarhizium acridum]|nr:hypothetical protein J3459_014061 [Metarhizium acridum]
MRFLRAFVSALAVAVTAEPVPRHSGLKPLVRRDETDTMTRETLLEAMKDASANMALREEPFTLIVQGGAVNVILGNRQATGDIDYIATTYSPDEPERYGEEVLEKLKPGWRWAHMSSNKRCKPIPSKWTDNTISAFFIKKAALWEKYKSEAEAQDTVLSVEGMDEDGTGIKFIAAPWDWQFVGKMVSSGADGKPRKPYDFDDAKFYLQKWLEKNQKQSVSYNDMKSWFSAWGKEEPSTLGQFAREVNQKAGTELITGISDE